MVADLLNLSGVIDRYRHPLHCGSNGTVVNVCERVRRVPESSRWHLCTQSYASAYCETPHAPSREQADRPALRLLAGLLFATICAQRYVRSDSHGLWGYAFEHSRRLTSDKRRAIPLCHHLSCPSFTQRMKRTVFRGFSEGKWCGRETRKCLTYAPSLT